MRHPVYNLSNSKSPVQDQIQKKTKNKQTNKKTLLQQQGSARYKSF